jgi:hypothetical protein
VDRREVAGADFSARAGCFLAAACPSHSCLVPSWLKQSAGDLSSMAIDTPHKQQLSVWQEFNVVHRRKVVWESATAIRCCAPGGTVILRFGDLITTFSAGLLYILSRCFSKMLLVKPFTSCAATSECFVVLVGRLQEPPAGEGQAGGADRSVTTAWMHLLSVRHFQPHAQCLFFPIV